MENRSNSFFALKAHEQFAVNAATSAAGSNGSSAISGSGFTTTLQLQHNERMKTGFALSRPAPQYPNNCKNP